ncbi:hypothetical protein [Rhodococcus artemisiae]|uniref:Uncharacterized protein n=1 Tax=Rhodococcus artemisiae TaxID=714159 RepID=A0ABU7LBS2_9NOCA|nr:hypothetical protein [Rhodococcus artemisiae]MEE2058993.1 hypothetical protein [Rhodococcus artemisiae]
MWRLIETAAIAAVVVATGRWTIVSNQDKINAIADQLDKARTEIVGGIADLKAQVEAGENLDFSRLEAGAQALDDLHEDAVPEPETPEVPVEDVEPDQPA